MFGVVFTNFAFSVIIFFLLLRFLVLCTARNRKYAATDSHYHADSYTLAKQEKKDFDKRFKAGLLFADSLKD